MTCWIKRVVSCGEDIDMTASPSPLPVSPRVFSPHHDSPWHAPVTPRAMALQEGASTPCAKSPHRGLVIPPGPSTPVIVPQGTHSKSAPGDRAPGIRSEPGDEGSGMTWMRGNEGSGMTTAPGDRRPGMRSGPGDKDPRVGNWDMREKESEKSREMGHIWKGVRPPSIQVPDSLEE